MEKRILQALTTFIIILGLVVLVNANKVFAKEEDITKVSDLQVGDFIPAGAVLVTEENYVTIYNGNYRPASVIMYLYESKEEFDKYHKDYGDNYSNGGNYMEIYIKNNSSERLPDYSQHVTENEKNYDGWTVVKISESGPHYWLVPANSDNHAVQHPTSENDYSSEYQCPTSGKGTYIWYKSRAIDKYTISHLPAEKNVWTAENDMFELYDATRTEPIEEAKLSFEFNAEKGDIIMFEMRGSYTPNVSLNGIRQAIPDNNPTKYKNVKIKVETSGNQRLNIIYNRDGKTPQYDDLYDYHNHVIIRNVNFLTKVNEGNKLDTTKVRSGDTIYHECTCADGYLYKSTLQYENVNEEVVTPEKNETTKNPTTNNDLIRIIVLVAIFGVMILAVGTKSFKGKKN